ncbi:MAG: bifunctional hexulose-6-phosphate synthase/ribonuclease regulator [Thermoplasmata archaeon M11B2D]|nr:MAG: bifunctional hexulose-6-phosphate synthase/ribonuclease regulator [Thermoplasmata archaeon M11B2D]PNX54271.1 MAG: bifunctional hexulose-6-phosphate synthase/ribonuclease regulator [Thermoplasmata archaeon M9B2D]
MKPVLQVALDLLNADRALAIAHEAVKGGADWLEAGTPLIKSEGMDVIRKLREQFPAKTIVADMKTMDTGALETEMAAKAGADVICLLAASDNSTIADAVKSARKYGVKIMVDLMGISNHPKRAHALEKLGVDFLCIHVGIDEQMQGKKPRQVLASLEKQTTLPIAVAGGLNSETVAEMIQIGASIIIVGSAITKAKNVAEATKTIKKALILKKKIKTDLFKKYDPQRVYKAFLLVSTPNISDAMHKQGALEGIRPITTGVHMVGRALTVRTIDGDWAKPIEAIDRAEQGTVLVVDVNQGRTAVWGELATWSAKLKGLAGVVIDGAVRDYDDLLHIKFPIFSRYIVPNAGEPKGFGEIGAEITCGNRTIRTGDWIIGDDSGVVVVPQEIAQEIANRALDVKEQEIRIREEIKHGGSLGSVLKLKKWEKKVG